MMVLKDIFTLGSADLTPTNLIFFLAGAGNILDEQSNLNIFANNVKF